jgi:hypothetical protein
MLYFIIYSENGIFRDVELNIDDEICRLPILDSETFHMTDDEKILASIGYTDQEFINEIKTRHIVYGSSLQLSDTELHKKNIRSILDYTSTGLYAIHGMSDINSYLYLNKNKGWFYPPTTIYCSNDTTPILNINMINVKNRIAFGTLTDSVCFSLNEITNAIQSGYAINMFRDLDKDMLSVQSILTLHDLLIELDRSEEAYNLYSQLVVINVVDKLSSDQIYTFAQYLLHMGMYFRGWKGPGFDYPLRKIQTLQENSNKIESVIDKFYKFVSSLSDEAKSQIWKYRFNVMGFEISETSLQSIMNKIVSGDLCTRVISNLFIDAYMKLMRSIGLPLEFSESDVEISSNTRDEMSDDDVRLANTRQQLTLKDTSLTGNLDLIHSQNIEQLLSYTSLTVNDLLDSSISNVRRTLVFQ